MNILGLDPSLTATGWVILAGNKVASGTITPKCTGVERLKLYREEITTIINDYQVGLAVMEGYAYAAFQGQTFSLGELGGVLKLCLFDKNVTYHIAAPTTVKLFGTGSGKAQKSEIMLRVFKRYDVEFKTEHETDAYILAKIGEALWQLEQNLIQQQSLPDFQCRALKTILKKGQ